MTFTKFDVTDLLDAIRAGRDPDLIRKGVEPVPQALIDVEVSEVIGAPRVLRARLGRSELSHASTSLRSTTLRSPGAAVGRAGSRKPLSEAPGLLLYTSTVRTALSSSDRCHDSGSASSAARAV